MAQNQYINKVIYAGTTLIDLTGTTATAETTLKGQTIHTANGEQVVGECEISNECIIFQNDYTNILFIPDSACEVVGSNLKLR